MRAATILSPASSNRARILPITLLATASGLIMDKVRSTAIQLPRGSHFFQFNPRGYHDKALK
jgi:hypothetical protein